MLTIYHNPRCQKSRTTLQLIQEAKNEVQIIEYLKTPPSTDELRDLLKKLGMTAEQIIRKGEAIFKENFKGKQFTEEEWIQILSDHPKLIERPIVVKGQKAVMGRPPENVQQLLS